MVKTCTIAALCISAMRREHHGIGVYHGIGKYMVEQCLYEDSKGNARSVKQAIDFVFNMRVQCHIFTATTFE